MYDLLDITRKLATPPQSLCRVRYSSTITSHTRDISITRVAMKDFTFEMQKFIV